MSRFSELFLSFANGVYFRAAGKHVRFSQTKRNCMSQHSVSLLGHGERRQILEHADDLRFVSTLSNRKSVGLVQEPTAQTLSGLCRQLDKRPRYGNFNEVAPQLNVSTADQFSYDSIVVAQVALQARVEQNAEVFSYVWMHVDLGLANSNLDQAEDVLCQVAEDAAVVSTDTNDGS